MRQLRSMFDEYPRIKQLARNIMAVVPLSYRLGKDFWHWYAFFQESETWTLDEMQEYQIGQLRHLLKELIKTSEFYRERIGFLNIDEMSSLDDFYNQVPTLTRNDFKKNQKDIFNTSYKNRNLVKSQTSGTTGTALQFYHTASDQAREWAAISHQWNRVGYFPGTSRRAEFRGLTSNNRLVDVFPEQNMIRCSILHLRKQHVLYYANEIRKHDIDFYHGYPSALYLLASEIIHSNINFPQPKAVLLASEIVYDWQVDRIQNAFPNANIFAHYGCAERTVLAGWCEHRREYHVLPQYGLLEIDSETSEIIGTNLYNSVNGFLRYRMTDTALKLDHTVCPDCHRPYTPRLIELGGRTEDFLFSPERGWIPPAIITYPLKELNLIREIQFYQKKEDELRIRYVLPARYDQQSLESELHRIRNDLYKLLGKKISFVFEEVKDFDRGQTGKFKWIISELTSPRFE